MLARVAAVLLRRRFLAGLRRLLELLRAAGLVHGAGALLVSR